MIFIRHQPDDKPGGIIISAMIVPREILARAIHNESLTDRSATAHSNVAKAQRTVRLPGGADDPARALAADGRRPQGDCVLVIDDDVTARELLAEQLKAERAFLLTVLGGLAEFERELIKARTSDGRARAKVRGVQFGRPSKLTAYQRQEALKRLQEGHAQTDVARLLNVSQPTISRLLGDRPFEASAGDAAQP